MLPPLRDAPLRMSSSLDPAPQYRFFLDNIVVRKVYV